MKRFVLMAPLLLGVAAPCAPIGAPAFAQARQSWDGTWAGGWTSQSGAQIIFAGDEFIGIYWRGDYIDDAKGALSPEGATATIKWSRGEAVLTREGPTSARVTVREAGRPAVSFALKKD